MQDATDSNSKRARTKIHRALAVLNGRNGYTNRPAKRYRTMSNPVNDVCPVCGDVKCELAWSEQAHVEAGKTDLK